MEEYSKKMQALKDFTKYINEKAEIIAVHLVDGRDVYITTTSHGLKIKALDVEIIGKLEN